MSSTEGVMNQPFVIDETRLGVAAATRFGAPVASQD